MLRILLLLTSLCLIAGDGMNKAEKEKMLAMMAAMSPEMQMQARIKAFSEATVLDVVADVLYIEKLKDEDRKKRKQQLEFVCQVCIPSIQSEFAKKINKYDEAKQKAIGQFDNDPERDKKIAPHSLRLDYYKNQEKIVVAMALDKDASQSICGSAVDLKDKNAVQKSQNRIKERIQAQIYSLDVNIEDIVKENLESEEDGNKDIPHDNQVRSDAKNEARKILKIS